jgi:hypothetical protein
MELTVSQTQTERAQPLSRNGQKLVSANTNEIKATLVKVKDFQLPIAIVKKALVSGLPNHISMQFVLSADGNPFQRESIDYAVTYDLWDEMFMVQISQGMNQRHIVVNEMKLLLSELTNASLVMDIPNHTEEISVQLVINPIEAARIKRIHRWIAHSKGHEVDEQDPQQVSSISNRQQTLSPATFGNRPKTSTVSSLAENTISVSSSAENVTKPRFEKLFDRLLKEYADPNDIPALWKSAVYVMSLQPRLLHHAKSYN